MELCSIAFPRHSILTLLCILSMVQIAPVRGNMPPPIHRPDHPESRFDGPGFSGRDQIGSDAKLQLTTDADARIAHLRLPQSMIDSLAKHPTDILKHANAGLSPTSTVIAGTSLSIAIVLGGLMLVRGQEGRRRMAAVLIMMAGTGLFATTLLADLPPRPQPPVPPKPAPMADVVATDIGSVPVEVEVVNDGPIQLTLPPKQAEALLTPKAPAK